MASSGGRLLAAIILVALLLTSNPQQLASAAPPANSYFDRTWSRTDFPVAEHQVSRTWMWGPEAFTGEMQEPFAESPGGVRTVQYFDKSRMEISDLGEDPSSIWYVTNGLLVTEMVTGQMQTGLDSYQPRGPANVNLAGDADDSLGPTYATFSSLMSASLGLPNETIISRVERNGTITNDSEFAAYGVTAAEYVIETNHRVASVFWDFMNSRGHVFENGAYVTALLFQNPFYATGFPITDAYWASVKVDRDYDDVLIQCFQRRCLTYTPSNAPGWQVEAGNVGRHYYRWRYGIEPAEGNGNSDLDPLPEMIWTDAYLYPETAVTSVFISNGYNTSPNSWAYRVYYERAEAFPGLYSISTVSVGSFNHDTRGFYDWLNNLIVNQPGFSRQHLCAQVYAAMEQPETEIARRLSQFEQLLEREQMGLGAYAYWLFLIFPVFNAVAGNSPMAENAVLGSFERVSRDFVGAKLDNPQLTFAQYSTERRFHQTWCGF